MNPMVEVKVRVYPERDELHVWMSNEDIASESFGNQLSHQLNEDGVLMGFVLRSISVWTVDAWFECEERRALPGHLRHASDRWFLERQRLERQTARNRAHFREKTTSHRPKPMRFFELEPIEKRGGRTRYAIRRCIRRARQ